MTAAVSRTVDKKPAPECSGPQAGETVYLSAEQQLSALCKGCEYLCTYRCFFLL